MDEGLPMLRELSKLTERDESVQGALAQSLDVLTSLGPGLSVDEGKRWSPILLRWVCIHSPESLARSCGCRVLNRVVNSLGQVGIPISQAWLAMLLMDIVNDSKPKVGRTKGISIAEAKERGLVQVCLLYAMQFVSLVRINFVLHLYENISASYGYLLRLVMVAKLQTERVRLATAAAADIAKVVAREAEASVTAREAASSTLKAVKALTELIAEDQVCQT
jgi:hypothetical protein